MSVDRLDELSSRFTQVLPPSHSSQSSQPQPQSEAQSIDVLPSFNIVGDRHILLTRINQLEQQLDVLTTEHLFHQKNEGMKKQFKLIKQQIEHFKHKYMAPSSSSPSASELSKQSLSYILNRYNECTLKYVYLNNKYIQKNKEDQTRRMKLVRTDLDDRQIETLLEHYEFKQIFQDSLLSNNGMSQAVEMTVKEIEERHLNILQLERNISEMYELFQELQYLVDLQQESLDVIEVHIHKASHSVEVGETELQEAEEYQTKNRRKNCCLLLILLLILIGITIPVIMKSKF